MVVTNCSVVFRLLMRIILLNVRIASLIAQITIITIVPVSLSVCNQE
jgi:hypothetical protein